jgi:hypothetical protein
MVVDDLYFDGDPETDSTRRRLERVMKEPEGRRRPWTTALVAGGSAFLFWRLLRRVRNRAEEAARTKGPVSPA